MVRQPAIYFHKQKRAAALPAQRPVVHESKDADMTDRHEMTLTSAGYWTNRPDFAAELRRAGAWGVIATPSRIECGEPLPGGQAS